MAWVKAGDPTFEAWVAPDSPKAPDRILLLTRRMHGTELLGGMVSITVYGEYFLLSGFHAPEGKAPSGATSVSPEVSDLMAILSSFQGACPIPRGHFREPREGSFDALVPVGWFVEGRTDRNPWTGGVTSYFSVRRDQAGLAGATVPGQSWTFADGWLPGLMAFGTMGMKKFMPATQFVRELLPGKLPAPPDQAIERVDECPCLLPVIYADLAQVGMTPQSVEISAAVRVSTHRAGGVRVRQKTFVTTARPKAWGGMSAGQWSAHLMAFYHAPEAEFAQLDPVLLGIILSFRVNPLWRQNEQARAAQSQMLMNQMIQQQHQVQQQMMARQRSISHTLQQTSDTIMQGWEARQRVHDHTAHQWSNAILGRTDVVDPSYGTVYSVPNDYQQYWRDNSGYFHGGGWLARPDPSWHKLDPINL
ncbi:MAG TPA: hypothetical protein VEN81_08420 [Planctomycetota bacterium]|nr:hypothetical protein [Planctomycetota bacterium]